MSEEVGTAFVSIIPSLKGFSARLRRQLMGEMAVTSSVAHGAGTRAGGAFASALSARVGSAMSAISGLIRTGLIAGAAAGAAALGGIALFGLKSAAAIEQTQIGFEALLGSAVKAKDFMAELQEFAAKTPFEFKGVSDAARRILAFGEAVGITKDQVIPTLTVIGDLVSVLGGTQESVDSVVRAFGQMASKGKVSQEELLQLAEALPGFNANAAIAAALGISVGDSMALITAGGVDAQTGINALLSGMANFNGAAGAMEKQAGTLLGVFSTFKDTIAIELTRAFGPVIPLIKDSMTQITPVIAAGLQTLAPALGGFIAALLPLLGELVTGLTPIFTPILQFMTALAGSATGVIGPLGQAVGKILDAFLPLAPVLGETVAELLRGLIPALEKLAPELPALVTALVDLLIALTPLIPIFTAFLASTDYHVLQAVVGQLQSLTAVINAIAGFDWVGLWTGITSGVADTFNTVVGFFERLPGEIIGFLVSLPGMLASSAQTAFNALLFAVGFGIGATVRFFRELPGKVVEHVTALWALVKSLFTTGVGNAQSTVSTGITRLIDIARELPGKFINAIGSLPGRLRDFAVLLVTRAHQLGRDIVQGLINGIKSLIGNVGSVLWNGIKSGIDGLKAGLGISSPSKVFADIGKDTVAGYAKGVESMAAEASLALTSTINPSAARPTAAAPAQRVVVEFAGGDEGILAALKEAIRIRNGGDVQAQLGTT